MKKWTSAFRRALEFRWFPVPSPQKISDAAEIPAAEQIKLDAPPADVTPPTPETLSAQLQALMEIVGPTQLPNVNPLWMMTKDIEFLKLNVKFFGYDLARRLAADLPAIDLVEPDRHRLPWKPSTQADLESPWARYWLSELKVPTLFHRKLWEFAYVLQTLHGFDCLREGARGLGFGCGVEPIPSYLAKRGADITITDMPPEDQASKGWIDTLQHASSLERSYFPFLVDRETFFSKANLAFVDMNAIPEELTGYDFCWSICALEHLGSIEKGLAFVENAMKTLKPGGIAVHTTEFNFIDDDQTYDNWGTVLFQRKHFLDLAQRLTEKGFEVPPLDFHIGSGPMDHFIDMPPFAFQVPDAKRALWIGEDHMKVAVDGLASTCYGLVVRKP